jgi:hypothetical protein
MLRRLGRPLEALLRRNKEGTGHKTYIALRMHPAIAQALKERSQQETAARYEGISQARILLTGALAGDPELARLAKQYAKTSDKAQ